MQEIDRAASRQQERADAEAGADRRAPPVPAHGAFGRNRLFIFKPPRCSRCNLYRNVRVACNLRATLPAKTAAGMLDYGFRAVENSLKAMHQTLDQGPLGLLVSRAL